MTTTSMSPTPTSSQLVVLSSHAPRSLRGLGARIGHRARAQDGFSAGAEVLVFGMLIFFVGLLLVINTWNIIDADMAVTAAAREAARTFVEADSSGVAAAQAESAAAESLRSLGRDQTYTVHMDGNLSRCQRVTATVTLTVEPVRLPGGFFDDLVTVRSSHSEIVDPYRSGLAGTATCP